MCWLCILIVDVLVMVFSGLLFFYNMCVEGVDADMEWLGITHYIGKDWICWKKKRDEIGVIFFSNFITLIII